MNNTKKSTTLGILGALSVLLVSIIHFPIFIAAPFLEYDPADIPILIGTFLFGPFSGFLLTVVVSFVQGFTVSASSGIIGVVMHIVSTGTFVLIAGNIYRIDKTRKNAVIALLCGAIGMALVMPLWNLLLTPVFMHVPRTVVLNMMLPTIIPFNVIKAGVNAVITFFLYKSISTFVKK